MPGTIVPVRLYLLVFALLLALTAVTCWISFLDLGLFNVVAAVTIAAVKVLLVGLYFMHLKYSSRLTQVIVVAGIFWLGILVAFTMSDFLTRAWPPAPIGIEGAIRPRA